MRVARPSPDALMWFGLFGAPAAWIVQHLAGVALTIGQCHDNAAGPGWQIHLDGWVATTTAAAAVVAVLAGLSAVAAWRSARDADDSDPPPAGRIHFLAVVGATISPLFLAIILMSGLGAIFLPQCVQS
jgi:heme/copper-type cytochrome/quinol oxidase subunit 2